MHRIHAARAFVPAAVAAMALALTNPAGASAVAGCEVAAADNPVTHGAREGTRYSLTFDEPLGDQTRRILRILDQYRAKATFFVVGAEARRHPRLLRRIRSSGHELANHSFSHSNLRELSPRQRRVELRSTQRIIGKRSGFVPCLARPPGGAYDGALVAQAAELGLLTVLWDVVAAEWAYGTEDIVIRVVAGVEPGSIVLFHQVPTATAALPSVLEQLRSRGLRSVRVTTLLNGRFRAHID